VRLRTIFFAKVIFEEKEAQMISEKARNARWVCRANIERYRKMLRTHLTDNERQFIERRLAQEQQALRQAA
jgi:hypothetical protein